MVTPTTANLLSWWFGEDMVASRGNLDFHPGQKQAILSASVAHEVLSKGQARWSLLDLYRAVAHIITDFDLKNAMRMGLVKSLVLDRRKEIGALPLEFKAKRDESGNPALGEGQRVMLRAGLKKLRKLEADFATLDPHRRPKMLVVCEDTTVSPLIAEFLNAGQEPGSLIDVLSIVEHPAFQSFYDAWCSRINDLPAEFRAGLTWHYVLLGENIVQEWQAKGARLAELLDFARLRPAADASLQQRLI